MNGATMKIEGSRDFDCSCNCFFGADVVPTVLTLQVKDVTRTELVAAPQPARNASADNSRVTARIVVTIPGPTILTVGTAVVASTDTEVNPELQDPRKLHSVAMIK